MHGQKLYSHFFAAVNEFQKFGGDFAGRIFGGFSAAAAAKISADSDIYRRRS